MLAQIEKALGFPVRVDPRSPTERSPHPPVDCYLLAPASANTVAKLALGIADNQALAQVNEAMSIRDLPIDTLCRAGVPHSGVSWWYRARPDAVRPRHRSIALDEDGAKTLRNIGDQLSSSPAEPGA